MSEEAKNRRPLATRGARWAKALARGLAAVGIRPNQISVVSVLFAAGSAGFAVAQAHLPGWSSPWYLALAALCIQLRLLCNLMDGMIAVEGGLQSKSGEVYNDFPDRIADSLTLVGLGYAIPALPHAVELGWATGLMAMMTAYTRVLGGACGTRQHFFGPMAKQHRMALTTAALLLAAAAGPLRDQVLFGALVILCVGSALTVVRRVRRIVRDLEG